MDLLVPVAVGIFFGLLLGALKPKTVNPEIDQRILDLRDKMERRDARIKARNDRYATNKESRK